MMICWKKARKKLPNNSLLTSNWNDVIKELSNYKYTLLNLSSVIHEVYSYSNTLEINNFWKKVFKSNFAYITIRDMMPSISLTKNKITDYKEDAKKIRRMADKDQLLSFEEKWGSINNSYRNFIHFLLKYRYKNNWEREVNEDYLPITLETLKSKIPSDYNIKSEIDFVLPFLKNEIKKDFNIDLIYPTHTKMIIKKT